MLDRESLKSRRPRVELVRLHDGEEIYIRAMDGPALDFIQNQLADEGSGNGTMMARIVCLCAANPDGTRMFTDADEEAILGIDIRDLKTIAEAAVSLNGLDKESIEDERKN